MIKNARNADERGERVVAEGFSMRLIEFFSGFLGVLMAKGGRGML